MFITLNVENVSLVILEVEEHLLVVLVLENRHVRCSKKWGMRVKEGCCSGTRGKLPIHPLTKVHKSLLARGVLDFGLRPRSYKFQNNP